MLGSRNINGMTYTDTLISSFKSVNGNTCAQVFLTDLDYVAVYPMGQRRYDPVALSKYFYERGVPNQLHTEMR